MTRRFLAFLGGALPTLVCVALAPPVFAQEASNVVVADAGVGDAGLVDGGDVDGGAGGAVVVAPDPAAVPQPTPAVAAAAAATKKQPLEPGADNETGVKGHVYDAKSKQPMAMAPVLVKGAGKTRTSLTDEQGGYRLFLPPGTYSVMSYYDMYHGARIKGAKVTRGKQLNLNLMLFPLDEAEDVSIQEFEIAYRADTTSAAAQDQLRLASSSIGEGFGAKQMSQVGASDAGGAAARVVGVQVEDNQLVVRGLGGRYTRVLLNGVPVPSTDPDLPGADLDLFPTSVIDSLNISKTFLPSSPADFAGGLMEIKSVNFPRKFVFDLQLASGFKSQSTGRKVLTYDGGKYDYLGFDDGRRSLPDGIPRDNQVVISPRYPSFAALDEAARTFRNSWSYHRTTALPPLGLNANIGDSIKFGNASRFGYVATAGYDYEMVRKTGTSHPRAEVGSDGSLVSRNDYHDESGTEEVGINAFGSGSLDLGPDHSVTALTLFNRSTSDETQLRYGSSGSTGQLVRKWQLEFLSRSLLFNQLFGDHRNLGGTRLRLRWVAFRSSGSRSSPDRRILSYGGPTEDTESLGFDLTQRLFSELTQQDLGVTASLRFPLWPEGWGTIGGWAQTTSRDFSNRRFRFQDAKVAGVPPDAYRAPPEVIFSPTGFGTLSRINEATFDTDSYTAKQTLLAGFALLETPVVGPLSFAGGLRYEVFAQKMDLQNPFNTGREPDPTNPTATDRTDINYLPGGNLKYSLSQNMLLRAAFGVTVSRPMTRELAPFRFYDFVRDRSTSGNPDLKTSIIRNSDLRWEWFFGEGEVAALSAFHKRFNDPIELVILDTEYEGQFRNGKTATNFGAEGEVRLNLGRISKGLKYFDVDGNVSLIRSRVELVKNQAGAGEGVRRLYGQAPYLANFGLRFHDPGTEVSAALVYNLVGPRITDVGVRAGDITLPNIEEQAFHSLDFIGSWQFSKHLKTKIKVRNILLQKIELKQGTLVLQQVQPGLSASIALTYEY